MKTSATGELVILQSNQESGLSTAEHTLCLPGFGSVQGIGFAVWVVSGCGLHPARVTAVVGLGQTEGTDDLTSGYSERGGVRLMESSVLAASARESYPVLVGICLSAVVCRIR